MSKEKKNTIKPKRRFPEFKDPEAWAWLNGDKVFDQVSNKNHNSDLPILAITQEYGAIPRDKIDYRVSVTDKSLESYKVVEVGDFIISLRSFQGGIEYSDYHGICSPAYIILRKKTDALNSFFKHYFKTKSFINDLTKNLEGLRDGKMVSYKQFSELLLPVPEPVEQQKIAACLSSLDDLITAENHKLDAFKVYKKGLMQQLFPAEGETMPKLRFAEFRRGGGWEEKIFAELFTLGSGKDYKHLNTGEIPVYGSGGYMLSVDQYLFDGESVCIGRKGTIDKPMFLTGKFWTVDTLFYTHSFENCIPKFIYLLFQNIDWKKHNEAGGIPSLSKTIIYGIEALIPKPDEQQKIADCFFTLDERITRQSKKIETLKLHKKGLMQGLFPSLI